MNEEGRLENEREISNFLSESTKTFEKLSKSSKPKSTDIRPNLAFKAQN